MLSFQESNLKKQQETGSSSDHYSSPQSQEHQQNGESSQNDNYELDSQGQQISNQHQTQDGSGKDTANLKIQINNPSNCSDSPLPSVPPVKSIKNFNETTTNPNGSNSGKWTREEHLRFIKGLGIFGKNWKRVESFVSTRSGAQIRSHAQKFFSKLNRSEKNKGIKGGNNQMQQQLGETSEDINSSFSYKQQQSSQKSSAASEEQRDASEWMHYYKLLYATSEAELASATASGRSTPAELSQMQQQLNKISLIVSVLSAAQSLNNTQSSEDNGTSTPLASSVPSSPQPQSPMSPSGVLALSLDHLSLNPTPLNLNNSQNSNGSNTNNNSNRLDNNNHQQQQQQQQQMYHHQQQHALSSFNPINHNLNGNTNNINVNRPIHNTFSHQNPQQQPFQTNQCSTVSSINPMLNSTSIHPMHTQNNNNNIIGSISPPQQPPSHILPTTNNFSQLQVLIPKRITLNTNNTITNNYPQQLSYTSQQQQFLDSPQSSPSPVSSPYSLTHPSSSNNTIPSNSSELKLAPSFFEYFLKKYEGLFSSNQDACPKLSQLVTLSTSTGTYSTPDKQNTSRDSSSLSDNLCNSPMFSLPSSPRQLMNPQVIQSFTPTSLSNSSSFSSPFQSFTQTTAIQQQTQNFGVISQFNPDTIIETIDASPMSANNNNQNVRKRQSSFSICQNNNNSNNNIIEKKIKLNPSINSTNNSNDNSMNTFLQLVNSNNINLNDNINNIQSPYILPFILASNNNNNINQISIMNLPK